MHGTAAEVGAGGAPSTGFPVVARFGYQGGGVGSIKYDRAVPCTPAEANGGQRCAALQEACTRMLSGLATTLELQGVPGWPQLHGLGCCEYRLNATHAAPLVVDARQPLQSSAMWDHFYSGRATTAVRAARWGRGSLVPPSLHGAGNHQR